MKKIRFKTYIRLSSVGFLCYASVKRYGAEVRIEINAQMNSFNVFRVSIYPSNAVNPPYLQYHSGVKIEFVGGQKKITDDRIRDTSSSIDHALKGVVGRDYIRAMKKVLPSMFRKIDKAFKGA